MADNLVVKIKYQGTLRRISLSKLPKPSFSVLYKKIKDLFQLSDAFPVSITYVDDEGDMVTMADDQDLYDAVELQKLNPLRIFVDAMKSPGISSSVSTSSTFVEEVLSEERPSVESVTHVQDVAGDETQNKAKVDSPPAETSVEKSPATDTDPAVMRQAIRDSLQSAWKHAVSAGKRKEVDKVLSEVEPLLKEVPGKLADLFELILKSGFSVSLEPSFSHGIEEELQQECAEISDKPDGFVKSNEFPETENKEVTETESVEGMLGETQEEEKDLSKDEVFHSGVMCDVCGVTPIKGPRYKSSVKIDYDLCKACYETHGVEGEYNKIERPLFRPRHAGMPFWGRGCHPHRHMGVRSTCPAYSGPDSVPHHGRPFQMSFHGGRGCTRGPDVHRWPETNGKLDARFVRDVTIYDGTEVTPGTEFTKIWLLRNNGSLPWPQHTRLVHVGGDLCGAQEFVSVDISEEGLAPDAEIQVSVDLVAPERPGRYVSHWRLMAPGGRKFGHRVWSLIQVVPQDQPSPQVADSVANMDGIATDTEKQSTHFDLPGEDSSSPSAPLASVVIPSAEQPEEVFALVANNDLEECKPVEEQLPAVAALVASHATPISPKTEDSSVGGFSIVEHPLPEKSSLDQAVPTPEELVVPAVPLNMEIPLLVPVVNTEQEDSAFEVPVFVAGGKKPEMTKKVYGEDEVMLSLLNILESMGFTDHRLNSELLQEHDFNLQSTVDELVATSEWDPMLDELYEMGFYDMDMNRRLMKKNKGSVKHVVKELVQMYKDQKKA